MNESLDLRNRILMMRKSNNLVLDQFKSESKQINQKPENINEKTLTDLNSQENLIKTKDSLNYETGFKKNNQPTESKKMVKSKLFTNTAELDSKNEKTINDQTLDNLFSNNEAQFRMIAEKFNEAVEVILELSNKVKKLEETVSYLSNKSGENKKSSTFLSLRTYILVIFTTFIILALLTFPFDLSLIKLIIKDVVSSI